MESDLGSFVNKKNLNVDRPLKYSVLFKRICLLLFSTKVLLLKTNIAYQQCLDIVSVSDSVSFSSIPGHISGVSGSTVDSTLPREVLPSSSAGKNKEPLLTWIYFGYL